MSSSQVCPLQAYCDQKSFGGGWQMCYTAKNSPVHLTDENALVYDQSKPYKKDGRHPPGLDVR